MCKKTPNIFTSLDKAEQWVKLQPKTDTYKKIQEDGYFGMLENGTEIIPCVHEDIESLVDEWLMIQSEKIIEPILERIEPKEASQPVSIQTNTYEGFDLDCGF
jgi:hypothetical protein